DPARRHADLALVQEGAERRRVDRVLEVRVGQDEEGVVAAELEHDALELAPGRLGESAPGGRGTGEVQPSHAWMLNQLIADPRGLARSVRDDVQSAGWKSRLREDLTPDQPADDRRKLRR